MNKGDIFETIHTSKWEVCKVELDGSFEAKSSDGVPHKFTKDGKFVRDNYDVVHAYDYKRPWADREKEDAEKAEAILKAKAEADEKRKKELAEEKKAEDALAKEIKQRREQETKGKTKSYRLPGR